MPFLLFDQIATPELGVDLARASAATASEWEWLIEAGLLIDTSLESVFKRSRHSESPAAVLASLSAALFASPIVKEYAPATLKERLEYFAMRGYLEHALPLVAENLEKSLGSRATPVYKHSPVTTLDFLSKYRELLLSLLSDWAQQAKLQLGTGENPTFTKPDLDVLEYLIERSKSLAFERELPSQSVVQIVLENLPVLDESVSWERILDFRRDERTRFQSLQLRQWMRKVTADELSAVEIREELEYLLAAYKSHIASHKIKTRPALLEMLITVPTVIENALKLKWGEAAKSVLKITERKIALMEAEETAPGREVAYIIKAREKFTS